MMNIALGCRDQSSFGRCFDACTANGYTGNGGRPTRMGATYFNDFDGNSLEVLLAPREFDEDLGFTPRRPLIWSQTVEP